jgi:hypothetical protein
LEKFWIAELQTKSPGGYNLTDGDDGRAGSLPSVRQRQAVRSLWKNPVTRKRLLRNLAMGADATRGVKQTGARLEKTLTARVKAVEAQKSAPDYCETRAACLKKACEEWHRRWLEDPDFRAKMLAAQIKGRETQRKNRAERSTHGAS